MTSPDEMMTILKRYLTMLRGFSVALSLVKSNALAAGAVSHSLMEFSAMVANPNGRNGEGLAVLAIADVWVHC